MSLVILFAGFFFATHSSAIEAVKIKLGDQLEALASLNADDGATLSIAVPGKPIQRETELGDDFVPFHFEGKRVDAIAYDFDGDGYQELVVRVSIEPISGLIFVYGFDKQKGKFVRYRSGEDDYVPVQLANRVSLNAKGEFSYRLLSTSEGGETVTLSKKAKIFNGRIEVAD
jgi:hypothetical protein